MEAETEPLTFATNCLADRDRRHGIELSHNDTQKKLMKEVKVEQDVAELLERSHKEIVEQVVMIEVVVVVVVVVIFGFFFQTFSCIFAHFIGRKVCTVGRTDRHRDL